MDIARSRGLDVSERIVPGEQIKPRPASRTIILVDGSKRRHYLRVPEPLEPSYRWPLRSRPVMLDVVSAQIVNYDTVDFDRVDCSDIYVQRGYKL